MAKAPAAELDHDFHKDNRLVLFGLGLRAYFLIIGMWIRSVMTYRTSFIMTTIGNFLGTSLDFIGLLLMFSHTKQLGGFSLAEIAFLYGTSGTSLALSDLMMGSLGRIGMRIRDGTMDVLLVRPIPVLAQAAADRFPLRKLGRFIQTLLVLIWALTQIDVSWSVEKILLVPVMILAGSGIFTAIWIVGAAFQFWSTDAAELQNSLTYGGNYLTQYPPSIYAKDLVRAVVFIVPLGFVNWLPTMYLLGQPNPLDLPTWTSFLSPLVAVVVCLLSGVAWRFALRSYRSTGS